jgi:hypothetical protein
MMAKLQAGQVWRTRGGGYITLYEHNGGSDLLVGRGGRCEWVYSNNQEATDDVRSVFGIDRPDDDDLMELFGDDESM